MSEPVKAVQVGALRNARGEIITMEAGHCLWCGEWVQSERDQAGATLPLDPCWASRITSDSDHYGDFGCDKSPESNDEGVGDHIRPFDVARMVLGVDRRGNKIQRSGP